MEADPLTLRQTLGVMISVTGAAVLLMSQSIALWTISLVGPKTVLGSDHVLRLPEGGSLLTNPGKIVL
jgi:hypothetical protein